MLGEFKKFAMRGNVVDLAVGVMIGASFTGGIDFSNLFLVLKGGHYATLADATKAGAITINYGLFLNTVISFLIVAFVLFLIVHQINTLITPKKTETPPSSPEDVVLLREIRDLLKER